MNDTNDSRTPRVLVVEDEEDIAELYAKWIGAVYDVEVAYTGREALDKLDDSFDVILLDRNLPQLGGDEVLAWIRKHGFDCTVVIISAIEPDFDIYEMGFDDYLVKPVGKDDLETIISRMLSRSEYDDHLKQLFSVSSKLALLETHKSSAELAESEEYQALKEEWEKLDKQAGAALYQLSNQDVIAILRE
ncbi:response regulator [Haladaptatus sp. DJG-WS-42]|uniref:response regulator n=1 Tax=Haladaptatus sp. DJG-WS-42 TaxID=3120516 RepID=UPI0030D5EB0A